MYIDEGQRLGVGKERRRENNLEPTRMEDIGVWWFVLLSIMPYKLIYCKYIAD